MELRQVLRLVGKASRYTSNPSVRELRESEQFFPTLEKADDDEPADPGAEPPDPDYDEESGEPITDPKTGLSPTETQEAKESGELDDDDTDDTDETEKAIPAGSIRRTPVLAVDDLPDGSDEELIPELTESMSKVVKAGPFIGPRGGLWADPKHTIHWDPKQHGPGQMGLPLAPKPPAPEQVPQYRYGMHNRPPGIGAVPKGHTAVEAHPDFRHGAVTYDRPLTPEEIAGYELQPLLTAETIQQRVMTAVSRVLEEYPDEVRELARNEPNHFAMMARQALVEQGPGHLPDIDALVEQIRQQVTVEPEVPEQSSEPPLTLQKDPSGYYLKWRVMRGDKMVIRYATKRDAQAAIDIMGGDLSKAPQWYKRQFESAKKTMGERDAARFAAMGAQQFGLTPLMVQADPDTGVPVPEQPVAGVEKAGNGHAPLDEPIQHDHTKVIAEQDALLYRRARGLVKRRADPPVDDSAFDEKDGRFYGWSTNELLEWVENGADSH